MSLPDDAFIAAEDARLARDGVQPKHRPARILMSWSQRPLPGWPADMSRPPILLTGPEFAAINGWYDRNFGRAQMVSDPCFTGAFYFEGTIWRVSAPLGFGTEKVELLKFLRDMPMLLKHRLANDQAEISRYLRLAMDCTRYHNAYDAALHFAGENSLAGERLQSADGQLRASIEALTCQRPSQASVDSSRLATEIFLKSYLAHHCQLSNAELVKLSHHLDKALDRCLAHDPSSAFHGLDARIKKFPDVGTRYDATAWSAEDLAAFYATAQEVGTLVVLSFTAP